MQVISLYEDYEGVIDDECTSAQYNGILLRNLAKYMLQKEFPRDDQSNLKYVASAELYEFNSFVFSLLLTNLNEAISNSKAPLKQYAITFRTKDGRFGGFLFDSLEINKSVDVFVKTNQNKSV